VVNAYGYAWLAMKRAFLSDFVKKFDIRTASLNAALASGIRVEMTAD
jgi:hypothetical protein